MEYDALGVWDPSLIALISRTWGRLPLEARRALQGVKFVEYKHLPGAVANAGERDVWIGWPLSRFATDAAIIGVLAHELAHVAGRHYVKTMTSAISREYAEAEADAIALRWGFDQELAARRSWLGV